MSSLTAKDRVSLCLFTFEDGRRCRTPRTARHPHFCFYHAQKEARSNAAETLSKDLAYFFSGDYLSACDLSTALSRLIPAVVRGDIKPKLARTVAYMFQTLTQSIHISQREYANAYGTEGWRKSVRNSVNGNREYLFPSDPEAEQAASPASPQAQPQGQAATPLSTLQSRPASPTAPPSSTPCSPTPRPPSADRPSAANVEAALSTARSLFPSRPRSTPSQPPAAEVCHPELDETRPASAPAQPAQPTANVTPPPRPQPQPTTPRHDPYAVHFDHNYHLRIDGKPF